MQGNSSKQGSTDLRNQEVISTASNPRFGDLATPINASPLVRFLVSNLPAYREGLSPLQRGLEVGIAHGYWLLGPFARLGPLRDSAIANLVGLLCAISLIGISTIAIWLYALSNPPAALGTILVPDPPSAFKSSGGWSSYGIGFLVGGMGGAVIAFFVLIGIALI